MTHADYRTTNRVWLLLLLTLTLLTGGCASLENTSVTREGMIDVPGGRVWYQVVGANRPGVPLLVLHGGPGVPHDYLEPLSSLSDERPVVFYDQLGCGKSDRPTDQSLWTIDRFEDELDCVRNALHLDQVHILGHSWGSMLAVDYMLDRHPQGVESLTLAGPSLSMSRWVADQRVWLTEMPRVTQQVIQESEAKGDFENDAYQNAIMAFYALHVCRLDPWPDCVMRALSPELMGMDQYVYMCGQSEFTITGTLRTYERVDRLAEIKTPTLFICGQYDEATPGATAFYQRHLPGSEMAVIPDASHLACVEQPQMFDRVLRAFVHKAGR